MSDQFPFVSCVCPTYLRPKLLANAIACFQAQDYPTSRRELVILDDAGQIEPRKGLTWEIVSCSRRFRSLPEKFNALMGLARGDIIVVWEDDDIYLPWHVSAHVKALQQQYTVMSKPLRVLSTYTGAPIEESAAGRFHASIAFWRYSCHDGWPVTKRADFDQQMIDKLGRTGMVTDTLSVDPRPSYVFRWGSTGAYHGQSSMRSPDDETWYDRVITNAPHERVDLLAPRMDDETAKIMEQFKR